MRFTEAAQETLDRLQGGGRASAAKLKKVRKALAHLQVDPRYPGLKSHQYESFTGPEGEKLWDSYVENHTPSAWRIFWHYGPDEKDDDGETVSVITVLVIGPHP